MKTNPFLQSGTKDESNIVNSMLAPVFAKILNDAVAIQPKLAELRKRKEEENNASS